MKTIQKDKENIIVKNRSLAEYNLSLQPRFEGLKRDVATAYETVNGLKLPLAQDVAKLGKLWCKSEKNPALEEIVVVILRFEQYGFTVQLGIQKMQME